MASSLQKRSMGAREAAPGQNRQSGETRMRSFGGDGIGGGLLEELASVRVGTDDPRAAAEWLSSRWSDLARLLGADGRGPSRNVRLVEIERGECVLSHVHPDGPVQGWGRIGDGTPVFLPGFWARISCGGPIGPDAIGEDLLSFAGFKPVGGWEACGEELDVVLFDADWPGLRPKREESSLERADEALRILDALCEKAQARR